MATLGYSFFSVASANLSPGSSVGVTWRHNDFDYGDALAITAHPFRSVLEVRNIRVFNDNGRRAASFEVVNVGQFNEIAFGLGFGWVDR